MAFSGNFVLNIIRFSEKLGLKKEALTTALNVVEMDLMQENSMVSDVDFYRILDQSIKLSGDPFFGLHAGENLNLIAAGLVLQIAQNCQTVKEAIELNCQLANLNCNTFLFSLCREPDHFKISIDRKSDLDLNQLIIRHTLDGLLAYTCKQVRSLTLDGSAPLRIHHACIQPSNTMEYDRVFGCPVFFGQNEYAIYFSYSYVRQKIISADQTLLRILWQYALEKSEQANANEHFATLVKQTVMTLRNRKFPAIAQVAAHLNMSKRSLQRSLQREGHQYQRLIEQLQKDFAIKHLDADDLQIAEIAFLLGYNNTSSFSRAFKKWLGVSPRAYQELQSGSNLRPNK